jgi:hypothetical protein
MSPEPRAWDSLKAVHPRGGFLLASGGFGCRRLGERNRGDGGAHRHHHAVAAAGMAADSWGEFVAQAEGAADLESTHLSEYKVFRLLFNLGDSASLERMTLRSASSIGLAILRTPGRKNRNVASASLNSPGSVPTAMANLLVPCSKRSLAHKSH